MAVPYNLFYELTKKAGRRFGTQFSIPVNVDVYAYLKSVYTSQYQGGRVLDFGSGMSKTVQKLLNVNDSLYHTCDNDPSGNFTYSAIDKIPESTQYEIIFANQVFEHLELNEGMESAIQLAEHVAPNGIFLICVPNPAHPIRYWGDPTHKTPWSVLNLCALMELGGLEPIYCARCNKFPPPRWYERPLVKTIEKIYRVDWCDTVYAVGKKA